MHARDKCEALPTSLIIYGIGELRFIETIKKYYARDKCEALPTSLIIYGIGELRFIETIEK